jgi:hypothetical protein
MFLIDFMGLLGHIAEAYATIPVETTNDGWHDLRPCRSSRFKKG